MTVDAQVGNVQGLVVIPVVSFQPEPSSAPGTTLGTGYQPELLAECRGIACRAGANPPRLEHVQADFQVTAKTGDLGVLTIPSAFLHGLLPVLEPEATSNDDERTAVSTPSAEPREGSSDGLLVTIRTLLF